MNELLQIFGSLAGVTAIVAVLVWALGSHDYPARVSQEEAERRFRESGPDYGE